MNHLYAIILSLITVIAITSCSQRQQGAEEKTSSVMEKSETVIPVRAKRLWTDYSMNLEVADGNYTNKMLEIEGFIMRVEESEGQVTVVFAFRNSELGDEGIRINMLPPYHQAARGINPFKMVKIKGLCTGYNGVDVMVEQGEVVGTQ